MIGQTISHYKILEKLGEGGMGVVYKAQDVKLHRLVALKVLPRQALATEEDRTRFAREAQAAASLSHPNVAIIHEFDEVDDPVTGGKLAFIAMEYVDGETVKQKVKDRPLPIAEALNIAIAVSEGLAEAHGKGIIHRDIKSDNIMISRSGVVKIMDFGLAEIAGGSRVTKEGMTVGTVAYMSPEQAQGEKLDQRTDIWSLGVVLYEMITGRLPFAGDYEQAIVYRILNEEPEPITSLRSNVPMELERIVKKATEKSPAERYQHTDEMQVDLKRLQKESESTRARKQPFVTRPPGKSLAKRIFIPAAILLALLVLFVLIKPLLFEEVLVSSPKPVAVIAFVNQTGDPSYDYLREAIPNLLITSLEQSKYLRVMTWERMNDVLKQMGKANVTHIDKDLGFELCQHEGIQAIVIGSFMKAGNMFATDVKVLDVVTKELLKSVSARGEGVQSIINNQIDELSEGIARGVGLSERKIAVSTQQIASVTTTSMEAYKYFLRGREEYEKGYWLEAVPSLQQAVRLDSTFAMAYLYLARAHASRANTRERDKNYRKSKAFAAKASEKERLYIEAAYAGAIDRDLQKRIEILRTIADRFPKERQIYVDLGQYYLTQGMATESLDALNKALALDPNDGTVLTKMAYAYGELGDYSKALEYLQKHASVNPEEPGPLDSMGDMYFYMGDMETAMLKYKEAIAIRPEFESRFKIGYIFGLQENYPASLESLESLLESVPPVIPRGGVHAWKSIYHYLMGNRSHANRDIDEAQRLWSSMENRYYIANVDLLKAWYTLNAGDLDLGLNLAQQAVPIMIELNPAAKASLMADLEFYRGIAALKKRQIETAARQVAAMEAQLAEVTPSLEKHYRHILTLFRGAVWLEAGKVDSAIAVSRQAIASRPSSLSPPEFAVYTFMSIHAPLRDVLARAYLQKGRITEAIAEYERLTTFDPKKEDRRFISPEYHYFLAMLFEQTGQKEKAIGRYEKFLRIWKNADPEIPELKDARRRLAKLKGTS